MNHMPASVPQIDNGTVTAAANVGISRRMNSSTTSSTRVMVISMVYCTSLTDGTDGRGAVRNDGKFDVGGQPLHQLRQQCLDAIDRVYDIGAG